MHAFATSERFSRLDPRDRDRLEALSKLDEFPAGAVVLTGGAPAEWLSLIAAGAVEIRARAQDGEVVIARLGPGDLYGEEESFAHLSPLVRHVAVEHTIVRCVPKGPLKQELRTHRELATGLLSAYARSISEKLRRVSEVAARRPAAPLLSRPPPVAQGPSQELTSGPLGRPPHLTAEDAGWLSVLGQEVQIASGERAVTEGDTTRSFFVVEEGVLEVRKQTPEGERPLAKLAKGDLFGFMASVDGKPRSASVVALGPCRLVKVEADALEKSLHVNFTVGFKFLGTLCSVLGKTLHDTVERITG
jgi:CRP-like cAMP-binding protein